MLDATISHPTKPQEPNDNTIPLSSLQDLPTKGNTPLEFIKLSLNGAFLPAGLMGSAPPPWSSNGTGHPSGKFDVPSSVQRYSC